MVTWHQVLPPPKFNIAPENREVPKGYSSSKHPFSGAMYGYVKLPGGMNVLCRHKLLGLRGIFFSKGCVSPAEATEVGQRYGPSLV